MKRHIPITIIGFLLFVVSYMTLYYYQRSIKNNETQVQMQYLSETTVAALQEINSSTNNQNVSTNKNDVNPSIQSSIETSHPPIDYLEPYKEGEKIPEEFIRKQYENKAELMKNSVISELNYMRELEQKNGIISLSLPNGDKVAVDVHDDRGNVIRKLIYRENQWIRQLVELQEGKMHGYTAFFFEDGRPEKIFEFKDNKADGIFVQFEYDKENHGNLVQYVEFREHQYSGLSLGWTPDGIPLKGSHKVLKSEPFTGIP